MVNEAKKIKKTNGKCENVSRCKALQALCDLIGETANDTDIPALISKTLIELTSSPYCAYLSYDRKKYSFRVACEYSREGVIRKKSNIRIKINKQIEKCFLQKNIINVSGNSELEKAFANLTGLYPSESFSQWQCIPVTCANDIFAVVLIRKSPNLLYADIIERIIKVCAISLNRIKIQNELDACKETLAKTQFWSVQVFENCGVAVCFIDPDFNITKYNGYFQNLFNIESGKKLKCRDVLKNNLCGTNQCTMKQVAQKQARIEIDTCIQPVGCAKKIYTNIISSPIYNNGRFEGIIIAITDISDLRTVHRELSESYEVLKLKSKELEMTQDGLIETSKMSAIGTLAAGVAHEFNNILTIIQGYVELSHGTKGLDPCTKKSFSIIKDAVQRGRKITRDLMEFYHQNGSGGKSYINFHEIIKSALLLTEKMINDNKIEVELHLEKTPLMKGYVNQLSHVLIQMISNSCDAMELSTEKRLSISLTYCKNEKKNELCMLKNECAHPCGCVWLSVADTGCGMDESVKNKIFEPFFTTKGVIADGYDIKPGTGLGLYISYEIIKKHNGKFFVDSKEGSGTKIKIQFPLAEYNDPADVPDESSLAENRQDT